MTEGKWDYINPDTEDPPPLLEPPTMPTFAFMTPATGVQTRGSEAAAAAETITEADKMRMRIYDIQDRHFEQEAKNITTLKDWVETTVETKIRETNCEAGKNLREWYLNLSKAVGLDNHLARSVATVAWNDFFHATAKVPQDLTKWVDNFEHVMYEASTLDLPLAKEVILWYLPLQQLTEPFLGQKLEIWKAQYSTKIRNNTLSYREIAQLPSYIKLP
ncbi:hypothetical protein EDB80DRAFT_869043 [Ilyonectria destructans]|nr:hypothetical protein EDB80DRAFT_869043 [Ilyonectria destructans]